MHRCLKCKKKYEDDRVPIFDGCGCGSKFFVLSTPGDEAKVEEMLRNVTATDVAGIEEEIKTKTRSGEGRLAKRVDDILRKIEAEKASSVVVAKPRGASPKPALPARGKKPKFGIETVLMKKPGVYEINIEALLKGSPVIVFSRGETYIIKLPSVFRAK